MVAINTEKENLLDLNTLHSILNYDSNTGIFTNKINRGIARVGKVPGRITNGYHRIKIYGIEYLAHRLAWYYIYKYWPTKFIDHIDGNTLNNRILNLREASNIENQFNARKPTTNTTGFKGVFKSGNKFRARIRHNGQRINIGTFNTAEEASIEYNIVAKSLRGEFYKKE